MKFEDILPLIRERKKIRRTSWEKGLYIDIGNLGAQDKIFFSLIDVCVDDWEIVEEEEINEFNFDIEKVWGIPIFNFNWDILSTPKYLPYRCQKHGENIHTLGFKDRSSSKIKRICVGCFNDFVNSHENHEMVDEKENSPNRYLLFLSNRAD